jgi:hypothetical protein
MVRLCLVCILLLGGSGLLAYSALTGLFQTDYAGTNKLAWKAPLDNDKQPYTVLRKATAAPRFNMLASLEPNFQPQHKYIGHTLAPGLSHPFLTRSQVRYRAIQGQLSSIPSNSPNAVERSWSTIKSMFR